MCCLGIIDLPMISIFKIQLEHHCVMISVCMVDASSMASCCSTGCTTQLTQLERLRVQVSGDTQPSSAEPQYSDWLLLTAACKTMVADCSCNNCF